MPFLNPQQHADLDAQRFDAPIRSAVERAMLSLGVERGVGMLDPTQQEGFDAQTRAGFLLCKPLKISPTQAGSILAGALSAELGPLGSCAHSAGTAFVNIAFADDWITQRMRSMSDMFPLLGQVDAIVDYSSPNCAKRMHVGGVVKVEVVVRANGSVKSTKAVGGNPVLIDSATDAIRKWKFEAASAESTEVLQVTFEPH